MSDSRPALPIYALLMVAIAGGSTLLFEAPFESTRPKEDQIEAVNVDSMDVPARLWQDPLSVVLDEYRRRQGASDATCDWESAMPIRRALGDPEAAAIGVPESGCSGGRLAARLDALLTIPESASDDAGKAASRRTSPTTEPERDSAIPALGDDPATVASDDTIDETQLEDQRATTGNDASEANDAARLLILPVMVRGGYYHSEIEARRRSRYAVLTALMYQEFEPLENRFLGHFVAPINSPESGQPENRLVAYEVLKRHGNDVVLVLWVPDQLSVPWPPPFLPELSCGRHQGALPEKREPCPRRPNVSYAVIGPATSDTLISLVADAIVNGSSTAAKENDRHTDETPPFPPRVDPQPVRAPLISPFATASGLRVIERVRKEHPQTQDLITENERDFLSDDPLADSRNGNALLRKHLTAKCEGSNCFSEYVPVGRDDAYLAWMMARELVARGIDTFDCSVKDPKHSVALIGESDRAFTKLWLEEMWYQARLECHELNLKKPKKKKKLADIRSKRFKYKSRFCKGQSLDKDNQKTRPACVVSFKYLQGLDGSGVNVYAKKAGSGPTKTMGIETVDPSLLARPVGESQFDYLRRLADEVRRENGFLRDEGSDGIRAIGIFGSDIYDKLLILQALKQELPDAIYFTNDLDARLTHPANYQWTRNLLVGSAYGLTLGHRKCIAGAPPFRDGYQSSTFMATLLALHRGEMLEVSRLGNNRCRWRTVFTAPNSFDPEEEDNFDLYYRKMLRPPGLLAAVHHWRVPRPRLYEISRVGAEDITPTLPYRFGEAPERFNAAVHRTAGPSKPSLRAFLPPALAMIGFVTLVLVLTGVTDRILAGAGTPLSRGAPPWKLNKYVSTRDPVPFPHKWLIAVGLLALLASTWLVWSTGEDPLVAEGVFEIPVFDRAGPTACEEACVRKFSDKGALSDCIRACPKKWEAPIQQHPRRLGLMAHAPTAAILGFWAIAVLLRWRKYTRHGDRVWHVNPTVFSLMVALNLVVTALTFWLLSTRSPFFEPMALASGTSSWPSELLRLLAIVIAVPLIFFSSRYLWQKTIEQVSEFFGGQVEFDPGHLGRWLPLTWGHPTELDAIRTPEPLSERVAQYLRYCRGSRRFVRTLGLVSLHILTVLPLLWYYGLPPPPLRGLYAQAVDAYLMFAMIPLLVFSAMFATDATRMCGRLLRCVASGNVIPDFSDDVVRSAGIRVGLRGDSQEPVPVDDGVREYLRLDFIAQLTKPITPLIILPFFLIMILVISRSSLFDNWQWNVSVLVLTLSVATYSILSAIRLRRAAEEARSTVIGRLGSMKRAVASGAKGEDSMTTGQVDALIGLVGAEERGAFNRWFRNPVVQALLLPFGGAGALALVEFALNAG